MKNKKRSAYLIVITLITIVCAIVGVALNVGGIGIIGYGKLVSHEEKLDAYDKLVIDASVLDLDIVRVPGSDYSISYSTTEKLEPKYEVKDKVLTITQSGKVTGFGKNKCQLTLEIPDSKLRLSEIDMDIDVGDMEFNGIESDAFVAQINVGDIEFTDCNLGNMEVSCDTGDIDLIDTFGSTTNIQVNVGDVDIEERTTFTGESVLRYKDITAETNLGEVSVNGEDRGRKYEDMSGDGGSFDVKVDVGDIDIEFYGE